MEIREITWKKKGSFFQAWAREIFKKGKILHVLISICLFRMFELLCVNVFDINHTLEVRKEATYVGNVLSLI